jgi:hypothetical protein
MARKNAIPRVGDTTQLVLKEELHIEMRTSRVCARRGVVLRREKVEVTRDPERQRPRSE